jgi:hypothetical protein
MPSLKEKAITLLNTNTAQSLNATATLYTTPSGKVTRITDVVFRDPSLDSSAAVAITITGFRATASFSLALLATANTGFLHLDGNNIQSIEIAANTAVVMTVSTGAATTATIDIFGYLT